MFHQVLQVHHEPQGLSKLIDHRSVLVYNTYLVYYYNAFLVYYYLVGLLLKHFHKRILVRLMFLH